MMITVKIRNIQTGDSTLVGALPFNELDLFVGRLRTDGVHQSGVDPTWSMDTQWVLDEDAGAFYFEVIVGDEDE